MGGRFEKSCLNAVELQKQMSGGRGASIASSSKGLRVFFASLILCSTAIDRSPLDDKLRRSPSLGEI